jgi:carboxymethylenebutenolidase
MSVETRSDTLKTPAGEMPIHVARPRGTSEKLSAVIVVQEAFGLNPNIEKIADRIAEAGYHVVAPNFYYREGGTVVGYDRLQEAIGLLQRWTDDQAVADVKAVVAKLQNDQGVRADRIGITGFCMGGPRAISRPARCRRSAPPWPITAARSRGSSSCPARSRRSRRRRR